MHYMKLPLSKYIIKRVLHSISLLFIISILLFTLFKSMPSDPVQSYLGMQSTISVEEKQQMKQQLGLDEPIIKQYGMWISSFVSLDLGTSYTLKREVKEVLIPYLLNSILLYGSAILISISLSFYIARKRALRVGSTQMPLYCLIGNSIPLFLLAMLSIHLVHFFNPLWDSNGMGSTYYLIEGYDSIFIQIMDVLQHMLIPLIVLVISLSCTFIPYLNQAFVNVYKQDYMLYAKAKGIHHKQYHAHAKANVLVPLLQLVAMYMPLMVGGSVIVEVLFTWPGMGKVIVDALEHQDLYLANACLFLFAMVVVVSSLLIDIVCALIDPQWKEGLLS